MDRVRDYIVFYKGKEYKNCVSIESAETMYSDNNYEGARYINEYEEKLLVKILYINEKGKLCSSYRRRCRGIYIYQKTGSDYMQ